MLRKKNKRDRLELKTELTKRLFDLLNIGQEKKHTMDIYGENTFPKRETSSLSLRRKAFGLSRKDRSNRKSCTVVVEREDT